MLIYPVPYARLVPVRHLTAAQQSIAHAGVTNLFNYIWQTCCQLGYTAPIHENYW